MDLTLIIKIMVFIEDVVKKIMKKKVAVVDVDRKTSIMMTKVISRILEEAEGITKEEMRIEEV